MRYRDTEDIVAGRQTGEVDSVGCGIICHKATRIVVDLDSDDIFGRDGYLSRGGVGIDGNLFKWLGRRDSNVLLYGKEEKNGAVAAMGGLTLIGVFTALGVGLPVPLIAARGSDGEGVGDTVVDREMEIDDAVAAKDGLRTMTGRGCGVGVEGVKPVIGVASCVEECDIVRVVNIQQEGVDTETAVIVDVGMDIGAGSIVVGAMPREVVAGLGRLGAVRAVVDGEE